MTTSSKFRVMVLLAAAILAGAYYLFGRDKDTSTKAEVEATKKTKESQNNAIVAAGPRVIKHLRDDLTIWEISIPRQRFPGGYVSWDRCIAAAAPVGRMAISCDGHNSSSLSDEIDVEENQDFENVRGR